MLEEKATLAKYQHPHQSELDEASKLKSRGFRL